MAGDLEHARRQRDSHITREMCVAMRALERGDRYNRSEIAFMFECGVRSVQRHVEMDCEHQRARRPDASRAFTKTAMARALQETYDRQPYQRMSRAVYDDWRDGDMPSGSAIAKRFDGSWTAAHDWAVGNGGTRDD